MDTGWIKQRRGAYRLAGFLLISGASFLLSGCPFSPASSTPSTPSTPACQTNNTATIAFENRSTTGLTYNVVWDGSTITSLTPGSKSQYYPVTAGVTHSLTFQKSNGAAACTTSSPNLAQCYSYTYYCSV